MNNLSKNTIIQMVTSQKTVEDMLITRDALKEIAENETLCISIVPEAGFFEDDYERGELCAVGY